MGYQGCHWLAGGPSLFSLPFSPVLSGISELSLQVSSILMTKESKRRERRGLMVWCVFLLKNADDKLFSILLQSFFLLLQWKKKSSLWNRKKYAPSKQWIEMNLIYKWEDRGWDTDSEILQRVIKEEEMARNHCLLWFEGHCEGKQCSENKFFILGHTPLHHIYLSFWIFL